MSKAKSCLRARAAPPHQWQLTWRASEPANGPAEYRDFGWLWRTTSCHSRSILCILVCLQSRVGPRLGQKTWLRWIEMIILGTWCSPAFYKTPERLTLIPEWSLIAAIATSEVLGSAEIYIVHLGGIHYPCFSGVKVYCGQVLLLVYYAAICVCSASRT